MPKGAVEALRRAYLFPVMPAQTQHLRQALEDAHEARIALAAGQARGVLLVQ